MEDALSLVSTITAVVATVVSLFLLRQGQADRRALRLESDREQASKVSAWADWYSDEYMTFARPRLPAVIIANSSDAAVYDVFVDFRAPDTGALRRVAVGPIAPGKERLHPIEHGGELADGWEPAALHAQTYFRDSAGTYWLRDAFGRLRKDPGAENDEFFTSGGQLLGE
jgi:hypothetical protein